MLYILHSLKRGHVTILTDWFAWLIDWIYKAKIASNNIPQDDSVSAIRVATEYDVPQVFVEKKREKKKNSKRP